MGIQGLLNASGPCSQKKKRFRSRMKKFQFYLRSKKYQDHKVSVSKPWLQNAECHWVCTVFVAICGLCCVDNVDNNDAKVVYVFSWWRMCWVFYSLRVFLMAPIFLLFDASTYLYKRVCPSVHRSICQSVRRSVRRNAFFSLNESNMGENGR